MAPRFHDLTVSEIRRETPDAVSILFDVPSSLAEDYAFDAGQYLTLRRTIGGEDVRRSYSICSAPGEAGLRVGVKKVDGGVFSTFVNEGLQIGESIQVMTPEGRFVLPEASRSLANKTYVAIAAGSGITPILSLAKSILSDDASAEFILIYGSKTSKDILFKAEFEDLKDIYLERLSVFHLLSRESHDIPLLSGRIDAEKIKSVIGPVVRVEDVNTAFLCGPGDMIERAAAALEDLGLPKERVRTEMFLPAGETRRPEPRKPSSGPEAGEQSVDVILDGSRSRIGVRADETIIDAATRSGMDLPFSCKGGMCCTCRAKVVEGSVDMALNYSLEDWELEAGFVLTCQSRPTSAGTVVDYDAL